MHRLYESFERRFVDAAVRWDPFFLWNARTAASVAAPNLPSGTTPKPCSDSHS